MNESPAGRDGYILAFGRRIYHVYKQDFPMEFIYGLTATDNREDSPGLIDVRDLPEQYRRDPIETKWTEVPKRSFHKRCREQRIAHSLAFSSALRDGYDLEAHVERERIRQEQKWEQRRQEREAYRTKRLAEGKCPDCDDPDCTDLEGCIPF